MGDTNWTYSVKRASRRNLELKGTLAVSEGFEYQFDLATRSLRGQSTGREEKVPAPPPKKKKQNTNLISDAPEFDFLHSGNLRWNVRRATSCITGRCESASLQVPCRSFQVSWALKTRPNTRIPCRRIPKQESSIYRNSHISLRDVWCVSYRSYYSRNTGP